jgi:hypothetical protein
MNRMEFQMQEASMAELAGLLRSPVLSTAIAIVKAEAVTSLPDPIPGVDYGAQVSAHGAQMIGWVRAIRALELLAVPPTHATGRMFIERQFDSAARRKMREAGVYTEEEIDKIEQP